MKHFFTTLLLFYSFNVFADPLTRSLRQCQITLKNGEIQQGWIWFSDLEDKEDLHKILQRSNEDILVFKRIFIPKYAKSFLPDSLKGFLESNFLCCLENESFLLKPSSIKKIKELKKLTSFHWLDVTLVTKEELYQLNHFKRVEEYHVGEALVEYSFFSYNPNISSAGLKKCSDGYFNLINTNRPQKEIDTMKNKLRQLKIIIVYTFSPC